MSRNDADRQAYGNQHRELRPRYLLDVGRQERRDKPIDDEQVEAVSSGISENFRSLEASQSAAKAYGGDRAKESGEEKRAAGNRSFLQTS